MANLSFVIYTNLCLELILLLSQIYFVADKNFTVEKPWIYAALGDTVILFILSICWFLIYNIKRDQSSNMKLALRLTRAVEAFFSFLIAVILILLVQKSELAKECVGYDHGQTPGPCNRVAFILFVSILAIMNGMTYFFSPTIDDAPGKLKPGKPGIQATHGFPVSSLQVPLSGPPIFSQSALQPQQQNGHPAPVTQAYTYNSSFSEYTQQMAQSVQTAVVVESNRTSNSPPS